MSGRSAVRLLGLCCALAAGGPATAQESGAPAASSVAAAAADARLEISVQERRLWWIRSGDTLHSAPVAVGKGTRLEHAGRSWEFSTPRGVRRVLGKERDPVWVPPDWHYVELARDSAWALHFLRRGARTPLPDGGFLEVSGQRVVWTRADGRVEVLPADEEVIFGKTLYVPPLGTANRRISGELGPYKLDLGDGYLIHGTPDPSSIGGAVTHGCVRVADADLEFLFLHVPVGTPVHIR